MNDLLQGENSKLKSQSLGLPLDALATFQELKMKCLTAPVLAFADFKKPFLLETDASIKGLGVVLSQKQDDGRCSSWKNPPLKKTLPFTGAQILSLRISKSEGGAKKNGYYHSLP